MESMNDSASAAETVARQVKVINSLIDRIDGIFEFAVDEYEQGNLSDRFREFLAGEGCKFKKDRGFTVEVNYTLTLTLFDADEDVTLADVEGLVRSVADLNFSMPDYPGSDYDFDVYDVNISARED